MAAFAKVMTDPSLAEFNAWVADVHGVPPNAPLPTPKLIYDSKA